jgi:SRSO17 transposase
VATSFAQFHQEFASLFGRTEARERSEQYLRGLLVQQTDRRNAENLAESVEGATARSLQRFLTESPWDDWLVIDRLQYCVGQRLNRPDGVFVLDDTGFAKQGKKSVGVARQYSGTLGKVGNCQVGVFLGYVSEQGHALVDKALYLPQEWTDDELVFLQFDRPLWYLGGDSGNAKTNMAGGAHAVEWVTHQVVLAPEASAGGTRDTLGHAGSLA